MYVYMIYINSFSIQLVVIFSAPRKRNTSIALLLLIAALINLHIILACKHFCLCSWTKNATSKDTVETKSEMIVIYFPKQ